MEIALSELGIPEGMVIVEAEEVPVNRFFNGRIRLMGTGLDLEVIIAIFMKEYEEAMQADAESRIFKGNLTLATATSETVNCLLTMHRMPKGWVFEEIRIE